MLIAITFHETDENVLEHIFRTLQVAEASSQNVMMPHMKRISTLLG